MRARTILIVDDDHAFRDRVRSALGGLYRLTEAGTEDEFRRAFCPYAFDLVILDMRLRSGREGLDLLREIQLLDDLQPVVMVSAYGDTDSTLDAVEAGALMFLHKQEFTPELLGRMVEAVLQQGQARRHLQALGERVREDFAGLLIGMSPAVRRATQLAREAANESNAVAIVCGEPGTEREQVAGMIHESSRERWKAPFVAVDARALGADEAIPTLFGRGGRDSVPRRRGKLEEANGGVLFLDEADALPERVADALGRGLRERRIGQDFAGIELPVELQLVVGIRSGRVPIVKRWVSGVGRAIEIFLPPLRERGEDISVLAAHFLQQLRRNGRTPARSFSTEAVALLERHRWPGNVRELANAVEFAAIQAMLRDAKEVESEHLPSNLLRTEMVGGEGANRDFRRHLARAEVELAERACDELGITNKAKLAETLGYNDRFVLMRRMRKCLTDFPEIGSEFPAIQRMFGGRGDVPTGKH